MSRLTRKKFMVEVCKIKGYSEWKGRWDLAGSHEARFYFPHKGQTCYLEFYRTSGSLAPWVSLLEGFYKSGKMGIFAWWETYTTSGTDYNDWVRIGGDDAHKIKIEITEGGRFNIHSKQHDANMTRKRAIQGDIGFTHISKPV